MSNIGIMDPAFFVGKVVLLKWLNDFFEAGYTKVEQTCTGAMHCQILDAIFPGKVPLGRVNFDAKSDYEYVANYKILQSVFDSQQITKHVDVPRLCNGKFQDNLEMLQWMKSFFDSHYGGQPYNAKERREEARAQYRARHKHAGSALRRPDAGAAPRTRPAATRTAAAAKPAAPAAAAPRARAAAASSGPRAAASKANSAELAQLTDQLSKLTLTIEGLEKERNFYFGKLREIEILCQDDENPEAEAAPVNPDVEAFKKNVLAILYATDENSEFQVPEDAAAAEEEEQPDEQPAEAEAPAAGLVDDGEEGLLGSDEL